MRVYIDTIKRWELICIFNKTLKTYLGIKPKKKWICLGGHDQRKCESNDKWNFFQSLICREYHYVTETESRMFKVNHSNQKFNITCSISPSSTYYFFAI